MKISDHIQHLCILLASYETDEPHWDIELFGGAETNPYTPEYTTEQFTEMLSMDHCGDCINMPATCPRCWAEAILHKATWIGERLNGPE
jgi:hypothetical protein